MSDRHFFDAGSGTVSQNRHEPVKTIKRRERLQHGSPLAGSFRSEREDWILTMVAAGMGICFLPEFSNTIPGVISRHVIAPSIKREVCLVTVAGRRWSSPLSAFVRAVKQYRWPEAEAADHVVAEDAPQLAAE